MSNKTTTVKVVLKKVRVLQHKNSAFLVEYIDETGSKPELERVSIPQDYIVRLIDGTDEAFVEESNLRLGIPYGIPIEFMLTDRVITAHDVQTKLHEVGVWTAEDIMKNTKSVQGALLSAINLTVSDLISLAREYIENKEN